MTRSRFDRLDGKFPRNSSLFSPSVCLSAANLRRFPSADSATGGADFKRSSKREALFLHCRDFTKKSLDILPRQEITETNSSLFEGVELAARGAGGRQAERRRSGTA